MHALKVILAFILGGLLGGVVRILIAGGAGLYGQITSPDDPSAGSVAIIGIFTIPCGMFIGSIFCAKLAYGKK